MDCESIFQLIYVSTMSGSALRADDDAKLAGIIADAASRNHRAGLTGMLLVYEEHFIQYLEGGREALSSVFESISRDTRHTQIETTYTGRTDTRLCPEWTMCAPFLSPTDLEVNRLLATGNFDPYRLTSVAALHLFAHIQGLYARVQAPGPSPEPMTEANVVHPSLLYA